MPSEQSDALTAIEKNLKILEKDPAVLNIYQRQRLREASTGLSALAMLLPIDKYDPNPLKNRTLSGRQS